MEKEIVSIMVPNCREIYSDSKIANKIASVYGLRLFDYGDETMIELSNTERQSGTSIKVIESNLNFDETLRWCKGVLEGKDIFKNSNKYIVVNGGNYTSIPGRGYLDMSDVAKQETLATAKAVDEIETNNSPVIEGFMVPFLGITYPEIQDLISCKSVNAIGGKEFISFGNGFAISIVATSLTRYQLLNWMKHIVYEGKNIYPQEEIVVQNDSNNPKIKEILKDCISLYEFKKNLLSK